MLEFFCRMLKLNLNKPATKQDIEDLKMLLDTLRVDINNVSAKLDALAPKVQAVVNERDQAKLNAVTDADIQSVLDLESKVDAIASIVEPPAQPQGL